MKIAINTCYGGFSVSPQATIRYNELKGRPCFLYSSDEIGHYERADANHEFSLGLFFAFNTEDIPKSVTNDWFTEHDVSIDRDNRTDPILIQVIEELGEAASRRFGKLKVVEVPDDIQWEIDEYDGHESVEEVHRSWS